MYVLRMKTFIFSWVHEYGFVNFNPQQKRNSLKVETLQTLPFQHVLRVYIRVNILVDIGVNLCYRIQNKNEEKTNADVNGLGAVNYSRYVFLCEKL